MYPEQEQQTEPQEIKLENNSLSGFVAAVENLYTSYKAGDLLFRGHKSKDYGLIPSIGRKKKNSNESEYVDNAEQSIFNEFCRLYYPYINHRPTRRLDMLFLAQHYGLPTRLLDWSFNPLIALYMSCEEVKEEGVEKDEISKDGRIFVKVLKDSNDVKCNNADEDPFTYFNDKGNEIIMPDNIDVRYRNQQGIFEIFANPREESQNYLYYIDIPSDSKIQIRKSLSHIGIDEKFIYPDMERLTSYLKEKYRNKTNNNKN